MFLLERYTIIRFEYVCNITFLIGHHTMNFNYCYNTKIGCFAFCPSNILNFYQVSIRCTIDINANRMRLAGICIIIYELYVHVKLLYDNNNDVFLFSLYEILQENFHFHCIICGYGSGKMISVDVIIDEPVTTTYSCKVVGKCIVIMMCPMCTVCLSTAYS